MTGGAIDPGDVTTKVSVKHRVIAFTAFPPGDGFENRITVFKMAGSVFGPLMMKLLKSSRN